MRLYRTLRAAFFISISIVCLPLAFTDANAGDGSGRLQALSDGQTFSLTATKPTLQAVMQDGRSRFQFSEQSTAVLGSPGGPQLPGETRLIEIPAGYQPSLEITTGPITEESDVDLVRIPALESDNPEAAKLLPQPPRELQNLFLPTEWASLSDPFTVGSKRYTLLTLSPYRYNEKTQTVRWCSSLQASVKFAPDASAVIPPVRTEPVWRELERGINDSPARDDTDPRADYLGHLVIIIPDNNDAAAEIQPLVDWKRQKGYLVTLARLGGDLGTTKESITNWLQNAWETWPIRQSFVLMVGDAHSDAQHRDMDMPFYYDGAAPSTSWYVSDNQFVQYEGAQGADLWTPEALIGRLPASTTDELHQMVTKIIAYEKTPFVDQPYVKGAVLIAAGVHSCVQANQAVEEMMLRQGYDQGNMYEAFSEYHNGERPDHNVINRGVDNGVGFVNFRGYNNWGDYTTNQIRNRSNGWKLPIVTGFVCATNDFYDQHTNGPESIGEAWVRAYDGDTPRGAVACLGPTDVYTHTWFNNTQDGEFYRLLLERNVHTLGALMLGAKLSLVRNYPSSMRLGNGETVGYYFYAYTLLGDPTMQVWSNDPKQMSISYAANLPTGSATLAFTVSDENNQPLPRAYVHIFKSPNLHYGGFANGDGQVFLSVPALAEGTYSLTATAANHIPATEEFEVGTVSRYAALRSAVVDDDSTGESTGNEDGVANPGETIELHITVANTGSDRLDQVTARLTTDSPDVNITRADADYGSLESGTEWEQAYLVEILNSVRDRSQIEFNLNIASGRDRFLSSFRLPISAYRFSVDTARFVNGQLTPESTRNLVLWLSNHSPMDAGPLAAVLRCSDPTVQIRQAESEFGAMQMGGWASNPDRSFELTASTHTFPGTMLHFGLELTDELGRKDSVLFDLQASDPAPSAPQGPDPYGYWAIDDRDTTSGLAPSYQNLTGNVDLHLRDDNEQGVPQAACGSSTIIDLPFNFRYYGQDFERLTIGSNGWMAFGESHAIAWNNQELGSGLAPPGLVAPYWDDLWGGSVFTRYDQDSSRFIIEWRNFSNGFGGSRMTFSVVLYDPTVTLTSTGDGEIVFQYHNIPPMRDYQEERPTVGISSPDRMNNITLMHGGFVDPRSYDITAHTAVKFTTGPTEEIGAIAGTVTDAEDATPMENIRVMIDGTGLYGVTDVNGDYRIDGVLAGVCGVRAHKMFYNDAFTADVQVIRDQTARIDFAMTHPLFVSSNDSLGVTVPPDSNGSARFSVRNDGNGPLDYRVGVSYTDLGRAGPWSVQFDLSASDTVLDQRLTGLACDGTQLYISGPRLSNNYPHPIYVLDLQGRLVRSFNQYNVDSTTTRGYNDLDWHDGNLLACEVNNILEITTDGQLVNTIPTPARPCQSVAYSPTRNSMFVKSIAGVPFYEIDFNGNTLNTFRPPNGEAYRVYGLAWHPADADSCNLYIARDATPIIAETGTAIQIVKLNPSTGEFKFVRNIYLNEGDTPVDIDISQKINPRLWEMTMVVNRVGGDHIYCFEIEPNLTWLSCTPLIGSVASGATQDFDLAFAPRNLPEATYNLALDVVHNAIGGHKTIPLAVKVGWDGVSSDETHQPNTLRLDEPYPNPFNSRTVIGFTLPKAGISKLTIFDANGRLVRTIGVGRWEAGRHQIAIDGSGLSTGIYLLQLESGGARASTKLLMLK